MATGLSTDQIVRNLVQAGWSKEQIRAYIGATNPPLPSSPQTKSWYKKVGVILMFSLIILIIGVPSIVFLIENNMLVSKKYGFKLNNIQGWKKIKPRGDFDVMLDIIPNSKNDSIYASFGVKAVPNTILIGKVSDKNIKGTFIKQCLFEANKYNYKYFGVETVFIPKANAYTCKLESAVKSVNNVTEVKENFYIVGKKYILNLSGFYRKEYPEGQVAINKLMDSFEILEN